VHTVFPVGGERPSHVRHTNETTNGPCDEVPPPGRSRRVHLKPCEFQLPRRPSRPDEDICHAGCVVNDALRTPHSAVRKSRSSPWVRTGLRQLRKGLPGHRAGRGIRPSVTEGLGPPHPRHGCGLAPGSLALREN